MRLDESKIIGIKCNSRKIQYAYKIDYNEMEIYAFKYKITIWNVETNGRKRYSWWRGYVELPQEMQKYHGGKILEGNNIELCTFGKNRKYELPTIHGNYNYLRSGVPVILNDDQRLFLGWEYERCRYTKNTTTFQDVLGEGADIIDFVLGEKSN